MAMNRNERDAMVKELAVNAISDGLETSGATRIDDYTYVIPVTVDGEDRYAKVTITACINKATKVNPAFSLEDAVAKYEAKIADREAKAAEKAEKAAAKAAKSAKATDAE